MDGNAHAIFSLKTLLQEQTSGRVQGVAVVGDRVRHPKRGMGCVVAIQADRVGEMRTHVRFSSGDVHRYVRGSVPFSLSLFRGMNSHTTHHPNRYYCRYLRSSWSKMEELGHVEVDGEIEAMAFAKGLCIAIRSDPNGAVAQWVLKELMEEANRWSTAFTEPDAETAETHLFYEHDAGGRATWTKPPIVCAAERINLGLSAQRGEPTSLTLRLSVEATPPPPGGDGEAVATGRRKKQRTVTQIV